MTSLEACELAVDLIRQLAAVRGELDATTAELAATKAKLAIYREIVSVALTQLHEKGNELTRERASRYRLADEFRALRERRRKDPAA